MADRLKVYTTGLEIAVRERTRELEEANEELARLATTDGLTGLRNHRYFRSTLEFELKRGARRPHLLALCMIDIDHFKKYNDTYGHPAGDEVLKHVGRILSESLRSTDVVARYGGEEFAVILLDTSPEEGFRTAQKIVTLFREEKFDGESALPNGKLTVSAGIASFPDDADSAGGLIRCADLALYEAKRRGRNDAVRYSVEIPQHTGQTADAQAATPLRSKDDDDDDDGEDE
jgi:diguanylate cyclase (GGDEF)-like protein